MNQTDRLYRITDLLNARGGAVPFEDLRAPLEVSRATLKRDLAYLRDRCNAPIVFDKEAGGYRLGQAGPGRPFALPGLWFSADEALALVTMHQLLTSLDAGGLLGPRIGPLLARLESLLDGADASVRETVQRVLLVPAQHRKLNLRSFEVVGKALVTRHQLEIDYYTRGRDQHGTRTVSPLRLVYYRNNWYLDAWCHRSDGLRMFALDAIEHARLLDAPAHEVPLAEVAATLAAGYGIYRGRKRQWATLHFTAAAAPWVRDEIWHADQQGRTLADGTYELRVPYTESPELQMDILRHGDNVQVIDPPALRAAVADRLAAAARQYR